MSTRTPNASVIATSRLWENLAQPVADVLAHIALELANCGALGAQTLSDAPGSSDDWTPTERAAAQAEYLRKQQQQIHHDVRAAALIAYSLQNTITNVLGTRITHQADRCYSSPQLAGYDIPRSDGGWHDPLCASTPRSSEGQCDACRKRMERWRERTSTKELQDERTITHDSIVSIEDGVAHVRPVRGAA